MRARPLPRSRRLRVLAGAALAVASLGATASTTASAATAPAASTAASPPPTPIGGPQLGDGLAVNLAPGMKALPTSTQAKSWIVADLDTGQVLAAYKPHVRHRPASTLKTLAALAMLPRIPPATKVEFNAEELAATAQKDGKTTRVGLQVGTTYDAKQLFQAMLSLSANDAAEALAGAAPGGRSAVLADMNAIAAALQAHDTHAGTPDGLDATGQTESAYDEALIARAALATPDFSSYDTPKKVTFGGKHPFGGYNHDRLQNSYPGVIGGKDGYTNASGQVWWGAANRFGHRIVVVVMDAGYAPVTQEIDLLNWAFSVDGKIAPVGTLVGPLANGAPTTVAAVAGGLVPGSTAAPKPPKAAERTGDSGPWRWLLGALILLAAVVLGRRHLRAAGPVGRATTTVLPDGPSALYRRGGGVTVLPGGHDSGLHDSEGHELAGRDLVEPVPAPVPVPTAPPVVREPTGATTSRPEPAAASTAEPDETVVHAAAADPAGHVHLVATDPVAADSAEPGSHLTEPHVPELVEPPVTGPAVTRDTLQAQHDRLHTGAVRVVPAPPRAPAEDAFLPR